nr:hypothetical protein BaRGS_011607 [Batillaria attramentaria]
MCTVCGEVVKLSERNQHVTQHLDEEEEFVCEVCGEQLRDEEDMELHMAVEHDDDEDQDADGLDEEDEGGVDEGVVEDVGVAEEEAALLQCLYCSKEFRRIGQLKEHMASDHPDALPYRCTICQRGFSRNSNRLLHERTHTTEKLHRCATCGESFALEVFNSKGRKVTILQCYAPTNVADEEEKENFYEQLQAALDKAPRRDLKILMGDLNAKVGTDNTDRELIMGKHGTGTQNENGELFTEFCTTNDLVIGGTIFPHKTIHKTTWTSPDGRTVNQIDHITIGRKWRRSLLDVRAKRGADAASDHHLVIAAIKIKLKAYRDQADRPSHKYNVHSLKESVKTNAFRCELRNRFSALDTLPEETIEEHWHDLRETWTATCREVLGKKTRQHKEWLTSDTWDLITERKRLKDLINHTDDQDHKRDLQAQYWDVNRQVKRSARNDKRNFINDLTEEAETAAGQRNMKRLYEITRTLSGKNNNPTRPVKDKNGQIITKEEDQRTRWAEHFKETLNRPPPPVPPDIPPAAQLLDISTNPPTKTEIIKAIKSLKSGKAAGPDGIPPEALKADIQTSTDMLHPLLRKIWESESVPHDWKKGHLVKLPKKGDLSSCSNWRGIMLLSIPGKVLTRIILERLKTALDKTLREEQAGFRNDRSCTDHIATMRIIIEQSLEWQTPLYSTFVDFQKAFDSVDREVIWKLMSHYGFPPKFVNIIRQLYEDATCQVIHDGKLTEPFTVRTGVRQGCILSPTIFLMVVDWVMRQATDGKRTGIQWTFSKQLEDLDFADDIALLSHKQQDAQEKLNRVAEEAEKTGLKINISKTEVMRVNHKQHDPIQLHQEDIKEVDKFTYLGSVVSKDGGTDEDIKSRTNKARHAFRTLRPIWRSTALSLRNKIRIFNSNVKSVLLYGSETWRTTKTSSHKLQTFINRCLRNILNIRYPLVITNQDLWEGTRQVPIEQEIKKRKWGWIGHTLRKSTSNVTRQSLDWNPQGKRKVGRPKQTWRRSTDAEAKAAGTTYHMMRHRGEKPHKCPVCHRGFRVPSHLKIHMLQHADNRFPCSLCDKVFSQKRYLQRHMNTHNGDSSSTEQVIIEPIESLVSEHVVTQGADGHEAITGEPVIEFIINEGGGENDHRDVRGDKETATTIITTAADGSVAKVEGGAVSAVVTEEGVAEEQAYVNADEGTSVVVGAYSEGEGGSVEEGTVTLPFRDLAQLLGGKNYKCDVCSESFGISPNSTYNMIHTGQNHILVISLNDHVHSSS